MRFLAQHCFGPQFKELFSPNYKLKISLNNRCYELKCNTVEIFSFDYKSNFRSPIIIGKKYLNATNFL